MSDEIERRFIVVNDQWKKFLAKGKNAQMVQQGYMRDLTRTIRVRVMTDTVNGEEDAELAFKTKTDRSSGKIKRKEWEPRIKLDDAKEMLIGFCDYSGKKKRYYIEYKGTKWTVDEFQPPSKYHGLKLAEVEFKSDNENVELPPFVSLTSERTLDTRFSTRKLLDPTTDLSFLKEDVARAKASATPGRGG
jgi:adenylate cyclase